MNRTALLNKLKSVLAESVTSQYWSDNELIEYLNEGQREFSAQSRISRKHVYCNVSSYDDNSFLLPDDVIEVLGVQYDGKPLDKKSLSYLNNAYSGTSHYEVKGGVGRDFSGDWRKHVGSPIHWYFEDGKIHCYPRRNPYDFASPVINSVRKTVNATVTAGENEINLPIKLPTYNKNLIDVTLNGVTLHQDTWNVIDTPNDSTKTSIQLTSTLDTGGDVVVAYFTQTANVEKFYGTISVGTEINPSVILMLTGSYNKPVIRVTIDGVVQKYGKAYSYEFLNQYAPPNLQINFFNLDRTQARTYTVTIYESLSGFDSGVASSASSIPDEHLTIDYVYAPADLANSTDSPEIPLSYHSAVWQYAAYLALMREGEQTQDGQKAMVYLNMFNKLVERAKAMGEAPIDIDFAMVQPFFV